MKDLTKDWIEQADYKALLTAFRQASTRDPHPVVELGGWLILKMCEKEAMLPKEEVEKIKKEVKWIL